jgi:hypothetical protein
MTIRRPIDQYTAVIVALTIRAARRRATSIRSTISSSTTSYMPVGFTAFECFTTRAIRARVLRSTGQVKIRDAGGDLGTSAAPERVTMLLRNSSIAAPSTARL